MALEIRPNAVAQDQGPFFFPGVYIGPGPYPASVSGLIVAAGNVGIGTTPSVDLHLAADGGLNIWGVVGVDTAGTRLNITGRRSKGTVGTPTIVASNNALLSISARGYDGADYIMAARIDFDVDGTPGIDDMPGRIEFRTTAAGDNSATLRMTIKESGNVGIGTAVPQEALHVSVANGPGDTSIIIQNFATTNGETAELKFRTTTANSDFAKVWAERITGSDGKLHLGTGVGAVVSRMTIDNDGKVGIGLTDPETMLTLESSTPTAEDAVITIQTAAGNITTGTVIGDIDFRVQDASAGGTGVFARIRAVSEGLFNGAANTDVALALYTTLNGTMAERVRIDDAGNVGIGTAAPDGHLHLLDTDNTVQIIEAGNGDDAILKLLETGAGDVGAYVLYDGGANKFQIWTGNNPPVARLTILRDSTAVGIGTDAPTAQLDNDGGNSCWGVADLNADSDAVDVGDADIVFVDTSGGDVRIGGLANGVDGQIVRLVKTAAANDLILEHLEATGTQKLVTQAEVDRAYSGYRGATFIYNGSFWFETT